MHAPCTSCPACGSAFSAPQCSACGVSIDPLTGLLVPSLGVCAPGPANVPISDAQYQNSLGVCLQSAVDGARRLEHTLGMRPYRVSLVWVERNARQRYVTEVRRLELMPVKVSSFDAVAWKLKVVGTSEDGDVFLSEISPTQVTYPLLLGKLDGLDPPPEVDFYYEIQRISRCVGDAPQDPGRYTPVSIPSFSGEDFEWTISLRAQQQQRSAVPTALAPDRDQGFAPASTRPVPGGVLRT